MNITNEKKKYVKNNLDSKEKQTAHNRSMCIIVIIIVYYVLLLSAVVVFACVIIGVINYCGQWRMRWCARDCFIHSF